MLVPLLAIALAVAPPDAVIARVGPESITVAEVMEHAHEARVEADRALDDLVREALLAVAARSEGLATKSDVRTRLGAERKRLAVERLVQLEVLDRVTVTDAEVADAFHARVDRVRLSMVVKATEQEARDVLARLRGGAALIDEAKSSIDPVGRSKSGVLGWFSKKELAPALAREALSVPLNEASGPVAVDKGFAIFVVHERSVGTQEAFQREAPEIRRAMLKQRRDERATRFVRELRHASGDATPDAELVAREASRRGLDRDRRVVRALRRAERKILARAYVDWVATRVESPTDAELEAEYRARTDEFWIPERRSCDILLARTEQQAEQLRARLVAGEAMEVVAKDGVQGTAQPAGKAIEVTDTQLDEMASDRNDQHVLAWTIRKTPPGIWAKAETNGHWHVIRCGTPEPRHRRSFAEVKPELMRSVLDPRITAALEKRLERLRRITPVRIDGRALRAGEGR